MPRKSKEEKEAMRNQVIEMYFRNPTITVRDIARRFEIMPSTARKWIDLARLCRTIDYAEQAKYEGEK